MYQNQNQNKQIKLEFIALHLHLYLYDQKNQEEQQQSIHSQLNLMQRCSPNKTFPNPLISIWTKTKMNISNNRNQLIELLNIKQNKSCFQLPNALENYESSVDQSVKYKQQIHARYFNCDHPCLNNVGFLFQLIVSCSQKFIDITQSTTQKFLHSKFIIHQMCHNLAQCNLTQRNTYYFAKYYIKIKQQLFFVSINSMNIKTLLVLIMFIFTILIEVQTIKLWPKSQSEEGKENKQGGNGQNQKGKQIKQAKDGTKDSNQNPQSKPVQTFHEEAVIAAHETATTTDFRDTHPQTTKVQNKQKKPSKIQQTHTQTQTPVQNSGSNKNIPQSSQSKSQTKSQVKPMSVPVVTKIQDKSDSHSKQQIGSTGSTQNQLSDKDKKQQIIKKIDSMGQNQNNEEENGNTQQQQSRPNSKKSQTNKNQLHKQAQQKTQSRSSLPLSTANTKVISKNHKNLSDHKELKSKSQEVTAETSESISESESKGSNKKTDTDKHKGADSQQESSEADIDTDDVQTKPKEQAAKKPIHQKQSISQYSSSQQQQGKSSETKNKKHEEKVNPNNNPKITKANNNDYDDNDNDDQQTNQNSDQMQEQNSSSQQQEEGYHKKSNTTHKVTPKHLNVKNSPSKNQHKQQKPNNQIFSFSLLSTFVMYFCIIILIIIVIKCKSLESKAARSISLLLDAVGDMFTRRKGYHPPVYNQQQQEQNSKDAQVTMGYKIQHDKPIFWQRNSVEGI